MTPEVPSTYHNVSLLAAGGRRYGALVELTLEAPRKVRVLATELTGCLTEENLLAVVEHVLLFNTTTSPSTVTTAHVTSAATVKPAVPSSPVTALNPYTRAYGSILKITNGPSHHVKSVRWARFVRDETLFWRDLPPKSGFVPLFHPGLLCFQHHGVLERAARQRAG